MSSSNSKVDVVIVPGGWSSPRHFSKFRGLLKNAGLSSKLYGRKKRRPNASFVIAHSVGCLDRWEGIADKAVILLGPIYFGKHKPSSKLYTKKLVQTRKYEYRYQKQHNKRLKSLSLPLISIFRSPPDPGILRHQYKLMSTDLVKKVTDFARSNQDVRVHLVRYNSDAWTEPGLRKAFAGLGNVHLEVREAPHDDIIYHPSDYVKLIKTLG